MVPSHHEGLVSYHLLSFLSPHVEKEEEEHVDESK
jgi:hypothetical protein